MFNQVTAAVKQLRAPAATREDRNIRLLMLETALAGAEYAGIFTFLPVFLVRLGASPVTVSLLTALPSLMAVLFALLGGALAVRWRHIVHESARWFWVMRLCYLGICAAVLLAPPIATPAIVILLGLSAIPGTIGSTVFYDVLADAVSPQSRPLVNGARWALLGLTAAVGVAIFGQLLAALPTPAGYLLVFALSCGCGLLSTWFYSRLEVPERSLQPAAAARSSWQARAAAFLQPITAGGRFAIYLGVTAVMRVGFFLPSGIWTVFLVRNLGASDSWIGWRMTTENLALTVGYYLWGRIASRRGHAGMFALVSLVLGACTIATSLVTREVRWVLFILAVCSGFFYPGIEVSLFEGLLDAMPADRRPRYVAINTALANVIAFAAPIAGASLAEWIGIPQVMAIGGVSLVICAALARLFLMARPAGMPVQERAADGASDPAAPGASALTGPCAAPDSL